MSDKVANHALTAIASQPWAIKPDMLQVIVGIASREYRNMEAVLASPPHKREGGTLAVRDGVGIIPVMGPIFPYANSFEAISGATTVESVARRFGEALTAKDVHSIVLHIDSPGGQITGIHELQAQILAARGVKPIVAYIAGLGASAAYWLASAADSIVADETAEVGSIGIVSVWSDDSEAKNKKGLKDYAIVSSQSPAKRLDYTSEQGMAVLQGKVDTLADIFIADVARNRGKHEATVLDKFGQGDTLIAAKAKKVGMIDYIGSLEGVIAGLVENKNTINGIKVITKGATNIMASKKADELQDEIDELEEELDELEEEEGKAKKSKSKAKKKKAKDEEEAKDDEDEEDKEVKKAALMAQSPALYKAILREGVLQERARLKALDELSFTGNSDLITAAKYTEISTAEKVAMQIVKLQAEGKQQVIGAYMADVNAVAGVPISVAAANGSEHEIENKIVAGLVAGMKGGKQ